MMSDVESNGFEGSAKSGRRVCGGTLVRRGRWCGAGDAGTLVRQGDQCGKGTSAVPRAGRQVVLGPAPRECLSDW